MHASDDLYLLIKSLTKAEKRHFKLQTALQKGQKSYLILFEAIDSLIGSASENGHDSFYDEMYLKKKLGGEISTNQLHVTKNYLFGLILKSLRSLQEKINTDEQITLLITEAKILERRGMYAQTLKKLASAKNLALKFEKHLALVEILQFETFLCTKQKIVDVESEIDHLHNGILHHSELLNAEIQFNFLKSKITALYRKSVRARDDESRQKIEQLKESHLFKMDISTLSFLSKVAFHYSKALLSLMGGDLQSTLTHYKEMYNVWVGYPHFKNEYPSAYIIYTSNYLIGCHMVQDYSLFPKLLKELKNVPTMTFDDEAEAFQNIYFLEQLYFMNHAMFSIKGDVYKEGEILAQSIEAGLEKYAARIVKSRQLAFCHNISIMFFALGKYDHSLYWLNKIQNTVKTDQRKDIQIVTKLLQLVIFLEMGQHIYLENAFKAFGYHIKKDNKTADFEGKVTHYLRQLAAHKKDKKTIFLNFKQELAMFESAKNPGFEELSIWVESKLQNRTFLEVLRQKVEGNHPEKLEV